MNIYIAGRKYMGKTTLAIYLARRLREQHNAFRFVVFEPKWSAIQSLPHTGSIKEFERAFRDDLFPDADGIVYRPAEAFSEDDTGQVREDFTRFCDSLNIDGLLHAPPDRPFIVVIDEAYYLQKGAYVHPWLGRMMRLATEKRLYIIQCVHRPVQLSPDIRGQADSFFWFFQSLPEDLETIAELCDQETAELVSKLPRYHIVSFDVETRTHKVWDDSTLWYSKLSEPYKNKGELVNA